MPPDRRGDAGTTDEVSEGSRPRRSLQPPDSLARPGPSDDAGVFAVLAARGGADLPAGPWYRRLFGSISARIALATALLLGLVVAASLGVAVFRLKQLGRIEADARGAAVEAALRSLASALARSAASAGEAALLDRNFMYLQALVQRTASGERDVRYVVVVDENGQVMADSRRVGVVPGSVLRDDLLGKARASRRGDVVWAPDPADPLLWVFAAPIRAPAATEEGAAGREAYLGQVRVALSARVLGTERAATQAAVRASIEGAVRSMAIAMLVLLALGLSVAVVQGMRLSAPLKRLGDHATAIAGGELTRRVPVMGATEIARLSARFNFMATRIQELLEETRLKATLEKELEVARLVQESLVPRGDVISLRGLRIAAAYEPAATCGGDWWTCRSLDEDRELVIIGDVMGHGLPAALIMAAAIGCCETLPSGIDPIGALGLLNQAVRRASRGRFYMSSFAAVLDRRRAVLEYANAGHTFPFVAHRDPGAAWDIESLAARGPLLGSDSELHLELHRRDVSPGDLVCWFSDGLTERQAPDGRLWGERRLEAALRSGLGKAAAGGDPPVAVLGEIRAAVAGFAGATERLDDMTVVIGEVARP